MRLKTAPPAAIAATVAFFLAVLAVLVILMTRAPAPCDDLDELRQGAAHASGYVAGLEDADDHAEALDLAERNLRAKENELAACEGEK